MNKDINIDKESEEFMNKAGATGIYLVLVDNQGTVITKAKGPINVLFEANVDIIARLLAVQKKKMLKDYDNIS